NDYFTIERSGDAKNWEEIMNVSGAGNSNQTITYFDTDYEPLGGVSYYRLKQTDFNGDFSYSNIVPVEFEINISKGTLSVFPNPIRIGEELIVDFRDVFESELIVVLRDITGKEFYSKILLNIEGDQLIGIPIDAAIPAGIYLITATSENQIYSQKLIIK
ncbi:MAG: T9SS type A sorting domain-containing protein, partial [Flavobacteriales bacterium]|nr:T9SS type A sorting domain-containing protein [Flavobacteriales bacterium]